MPSYKYGARTAWISAPQQLSSTTSNVVLGAWQYIPGSAPGLSDFTPENIKAATLVFPAAIATVASTAAGGSMQLIVTQYNSTAASVNSAVVFNQAVSSAAAHSTLDVSTLVNWTLTAGDHLELLASANTVGVPTFGGVTFSVTVDPVTSL